MDSSWSNTTRVVVTLLALAGGIWLAVVASPLLEALLIAALLAHLVNPAVRWVMQRASLSRAWVATIVFLFTLVIVLGIPAAVGTVAFSSIRRLGTDLATAATELEEILFRPVDILGFRLEPPDLIDILRNIGTDLLATLPGGSLNILSSVTTNLVWAVVVLVMFYYLLRDGQKIKPWLVTLFPVPYQPEVQRLLDEVDRVWGRFLRIQLLMFLLISVLMIVGTLLIVALFRTGLLRWSPLGFIVLVVLLYTAIQQLDNLWIRPHVLGKQLRLHPGLVFAGLIGALMLSGFLGALVVVPLMATAKVVGRYVHRKLLGLPPWADEEEESPDEAAQADDETETGVQEEEPVYPV